MKTSIKVGAALLLSGILIATTMPRRVEAQNQRQQAFWTIVIQGEASDGSGFVVERISATPSAPLIHVGDDLAESLTLAKAAGGQVTIHAWGFLTYTITSGQ